MSLAIRTPARTNRMAKRAKSSMPGKKRSIKLRIPTAVYIGRQAFPKQLHNTLTYSEKIDLAMVGSGLANSYLFKCNGLFDPDTTGTGHQPAQFDRLSGLYHHYHVKSSRITLKFASTSTSDVTTACLFQNPDTTPLLSLTISTAMERPGATFVTGNLKNESKTLYSTWSAKKEFGGSPMSDPELSGTASVDPVELTHYCFAYADTAGSTSYLITGVKIEYDVVWYELRTEPQN